MRRLDRMAAAQIVQAKRDCLRSAFVRSTPKVREVRRRPAELATVLAVCIGGRERSSTMCAPVCSGRWNAPAADVTAGRFLNETFAW